MNKQERERAQASDKAQASAKAAGKSSSDQAKAGRDAAERVANKQGSFSVGWPAGDKR